VIEVLKAAFVQGRLAKDELDARAGRALAAQTRAELAALTADIPVGPARAESPPVPARARPRPPVSPEVKAGVRVIAATYLIAALLWLSAMLAGDNAVGGSFFFLAFMASVVAVFSTLYGAVVLLGKHSARQLPPAA
jgi:hypothetical protein